MHGCIVGETGHRCGVGGVSQVDYLQAVVVGRDGHRIQAGSYTYGVNGHRPVQRHRTIVGETGHRCGVGGASQVDYLQAVVGGRGDDRIGAGSRRKGVHIVCAVQRHRTIVGETGHRCGVGGASQVDYLQAVVGGSDDRIGAGSYPDDIHRRGPAKGGGAIICYRRYDPGAVGIRDVDHQDGVTI